MNPNEPRYTAVAIVVHRAIAAAILSNLIVGWWMKDAIHETAAQARAIAAFRLHRPTGTIYYERLDRLEMPLVSNQRSPHGYYGNCKKIGRALPPG